MFPDETGHWRHDWRSFGPNQGSASLAGHLTEKRGYAAGSFARGTPSGKSWRRSLSMPECTRNEEYTGKPNIRQWRINARPSVAQVSVSINLFQFGTFRCSEDTLLFLYWREAGLKQRSSSSAMCCGKGARPHQGGRKHSAQWAKLPAPPTTSSMMLNNDSSSGPLQTRMAIKELTHGNYISRSRESYNRSVRKEALWAYVNAAYKLID